MELDFDKMLADYKSAAPNQARQQVRSRNYTSVHSALKQRYGKQGLLYWLKRLWRGR